jgi:hypothetical protein
VFSEPRLLMPPKTITPAERAARKGQPVPVAGFRKKGCKTCKPIPVYPRPPLSLESVKPAIREITIRHGYD